MKEFIPNRQLRLMLIMPGNGADVCCAVGIAVRGGLLGPRGGVRMEYQMRKDLFSTFKP